MRAILIDPTAETIEEIDIPRFDDVRDLYELLGVGNVQGAYEHFPATDDVIYVDGEGLLKRDAGPFFQVRDYQPLAGRGVVVGTSRTGRATSPRTTLKVAKELVHFPHLELVGFEPITDIVRLPGLEGGVVISGSEAVFRPKR